MRVLIFSVTAGYGHISTARAIADECTARGDTVLLEDLYQRISKISYELIDSGYLFAVKHLQKSYEQTYRHLEQSHRLRRMARILTSNMVLARRILAFISAYEPDYIVTTHPFAGLVMHKLKRKNLLQVPCLGVVTDYCIHPGWEDCQYLERVVTASACLDFIAREKGMAKTQIAPLGIPTRAVFRQRTPQTVAREQLGLLPDTPTVLMMGGSMGHGDMCAMVSEILRLDLGLQLLCICGRNEKLFQQLSQMVTGGQLSVQGFVDNVDVYMDAADCIVTKPGGLTVTEALCKQLPMILVNPIPGQEERNAEFLLNNGAALQVTESFSIGEAVYYLFAQAGRLSVMEQSLALLAKPHAAEQICDMAETLCAENPPD